MTTPMLPPQIQGGPPVQTGGSSPNADLEHNVVGQLNQFNAQRDMQLQAYLQRLGMLKQPMPTTAVANAGQVPSSEWGDDDLLGAAKFWGIPQEAAMAMPRDHLIQILNTLRTQARPSDTQSSSLINAGAAASMFGVGAAEAVTQGLHNLPVIGEALGRIGALHQADIYFKSLEEGLRAATPESIQPVLTGEKWTGNLATLAMPANAAWNVMGKMPLVSRMTPILRGAVQGAGSAWLLEGGSDAYENNPSGILLPSAVLGAAFPLAASLWKKVSPMLGAVQNRVTGAFVPKPSATEGLTSEETATATAPTTATASAGTATTAPPAGFEPTQPLAPPTGFQPNEPAGSIPLAQAPLPQGFQVTSGEVAQFGDQFPSNQIVSAGGAVDAPRNPAVFFPQGQAFTQARPEGSIGAMGEMGYQSSSGLKTVRRPAGLDFSDATANASGLNKAAIVLESPDLPMLAQSTVMDESTVAKAAQGTNPGGVNLVQGVKDPASFAQTVEGNVAFVNPPGSTRLDALVSDAPVTKDMIADYQTHGAYVGQDAVSKAGLTGKIKKINAAAQAIFQPLNGVEVTLPVSELSPAAVSPQATTAPMLWKGLQQYVDARVGEFAGQLSGPLATEEQMALIKQQNLPHYVEGFLDQTGIKNPAERARLTSYFNEQYVASFKSLAPAESGAADVLAARAQAAPKVDETPLQVLDAKAAVKGFHVVPEADGGVTLRDAVTPQAGAAPVEVKMASTEAAGEWLKEYGDRQLPDASPPSDVPLEVAAMHPTVGAQPNLNAGREQGLVNAIAELGEGSLETPEYKAWAQTLHQHAQSLVGTGQLGTLQNIYQNGLTNWSGMRRLFSNMDEFAAKAGLYEKGWHPFADYDKISQAVNLRSNMEQPWIVRWQGISNDITPAMKRSGVWSQMYLNPDRTLRLTNSLKAGLSVDEIAAFDKVTSFWHDLFGETGLQAEREIPGYLPMLQKMQSTGDFSAMDQWQNVNPFHTAFFEQVRRGAVNVRELDPDVLANTYIKSWSWQNAMDAPFSEVAQRYNAIAQQVPELAPAAKITQNWLQQIRHGYQDGNDPILDAAHAMLQTFVGPNITKMQARTLMNGALQYSYSSLMGFRIDLAARDLQQVWMALPRAGTKLTSVMNEFATGGTEARSAMWQEALNDNMVSLIHPRSQAPGALEIGADPLAAPLSTLPNTPTQDALAKLSDTLQGMKPAWMNDPRFGPSYLYGLQGEAIRMFSGIAGKRVAQEALSTFRAGGSSNLDALLADSKAATYYPAVQRQFQQYVAAGQDTEAAAFLGRQLADASQFKYGPAESPINMRTMTGRVGLQLGSYPMQYLQFLGESLRNGSTADKAKLIATMGAVSAGFALATKQTGWDFNRMNPYTGLGFAGGPVMAQAGELAQSFSGALDQATGQTRGGGGAGAAPSIPQALGQTAALFNPLGGLVRTGEAAANALQGPTPAMGLLRVGLTGEMSNAADINNALLPQADAMFQASLRPLQSQLTSGFTGTTQIPQQIVTQPLEMGGQGITPSQTLGGAQGVAPAQNPTGLTQQQHYDSAYAQLRQQGMPDTGIVHILGRRP